LCFLSLTLAGAYHHASVEYIDPETGSLNQIHLRDAMPLLLSGWEEFIKASDEDNWEGHDWRRGFASRFANLDERHHLDTLGLTSAAEKDEIKRAYKDLARIWHPDKHASESESSRATAKDTFIKVQEAYEFLTNRQSTGVGGRRGDGGDGASFTFRRASGSSAKAGRRKTEQEGGGGIDESRKKRPNRSSSSSSRKKESTTEDDTESIPPSHRRSDEEKKKRAPPAAQAKTPPSTSTTNKTSSGSSAGGGSASTTHGKEGEQKKRRQQGDTKRPKQSSKKKTTTRKEL
jgi:curved DNA-binding protein CbpA